MDSRMFDGQTTGASAIEATRWARSAGLDTRCWISADLIAALAPPGERERLDEEKVAAAAMAILGRVRRAMDGSQAAVRFVFKAGSNGNEQSLEAAYVTDETGPVLVVRRA